MKDLTGQKFGRLTVIKYSHLIKKKGYTHYWLCKCDCGNELFVAGASLKNGHTQSCGCYHKETVTKHGFGDKRLYRIYYKMYSRCNDKNNKSFKNYGERGIKVCEEWLNDKSEFFEWAVANGYQEGLTLDRIDVNGNYEPSNCRWTDMKTQQRNRRNNKFITYNGETHCLAEWAEIYSIEYSTLDYRLKRKWDFKRALITPPLFNAKIK